METIPVLFMPLINKETSKKKQPSCALYVHVPYCESKCYFCSIPTHIGDHDMENYISSLQQELAYQGSKLSGKIIMAVHIGGGTPSMLPLHLLKKLFETLESFVPNLKDINILFEAHPSSLTGEKLSFLKIYPNLRINMGVQSFNAQRLLKMNRQVLKMTMEDVIKQVQGLDIGLGIDLMIGLPGATKKIILSDLEQAIEKNIDHISIYPFRVEAGTYIHSHQSEFDMMPSLEIESLYSACEKILEKSGYKPYSIFHWSKDTTFKNMYFNIQSQGGEWLGVGKGAYSYMDQKVYQYHSHFKEVVFAEHNLTAKFIWDMSFMFRRRCISKEQVIGHHGRLAGEPLNRIIDALLQKDYVRTDQDHVMITTKGIIAFDDVEEVIRKVVCE